MHTLLDMRGNIPSFIHISNGKLHDVHALDMLLPEPGAIYVMDRGYVDFARLHVLHEAGAFFVTRAKSNMDAHRVYSAPADRSVGVISDQTIAMDGYVTQQHYPAHLRRIRFKDPETGKTLIFLTNQVTLPALTICALYKSRWQVELFFKWIKQHLRIKQFYGTSENAVKTQIWVAVSVYVLVAIVRWEADLAEAARLAGTAIRLNESDALALALYGHIQSFVFRDYDRATAFLDRAIEVGPSLATAWWMSSLNCSYIGHGNLAVERAQRALRLTPLDAFRFWPEAIMGQAYYVEGNYEEAVTWAQRAVGRNGPVSFALRTLTASLMALGKGEAARTAGQQLMRALPRFSIRRYEERCPFQGEVLATWLHRLRAAGLPE